jgi:predicted esterase
MSDFPFADFGAFYSHLFGLYQEQRYTEALNFATHEFGRFPDQAPLLYHFRACMASCAGDGPLALRLLGESMDGGHWYSDRYWDDADFNLVKDDPEFARLRAISTERYAARRANSRPALAVESPDASGPLPLLWALHGNTQNSARAKTSWLPAVTLGWRLALPQSSQIVGHDSFVWDERDTREQELRDNWTSLSQQYAIDEQRTVIGGFSMGGETAIVTALTGVVPLRGFIAVAPGGPLTGQPEAWKPLIEAVQGRGVRGVIIIGGRDQLTGQTRTLVKQLNAGGVPCELVEYAEMAHAYPPDFAERLPGWLDFVLGKVRALTEVHTLFGAARQAIGGLFGAAYEQQVEALELGDQDSYLLAVASDFEPQPISATRLDLRNPYSNAQFAVDNLEDMARRGLMEALGGGEYCLTAAGHAKVRALDQILRDTLGNCPPLPDTERCAALLRKLVEAALVAAEPADRTCVTINRHSDPGPQGPVLLRILQYLADLNAFRDDAHLGAWRPTGVSGPAWEAFTFLWRGDVANAAQLAEKLPYRHFTADDYSTFLGELVDRGWIAAEDGTYRVTDAGRTQRQQVEDLTDRYYYGAWQALSPAEVTNLGEHLERLRDGVKAFQPA